MIKFFSLISLIAVFPIGVFVVDARPHVMSPPSIYIDGKTLDERLAKLAYFSAQQDIRGREARKVMIPITARLVQGKDVNLCLKRWNEVSLDVYQASKKRLEVNPKDNNARNPFEKHALIHSYMICRDKISLPQPTIDLMKSYVSLYKHKNWFGYGALNYKLMNDGAGFIAAEQWPDLIDSDGLNSAQIAAATKARLFALFDEIVRYNTDEYAAPGYLGIDFSAMKLLADFAKDPVMRLRATLTLDSMILHAVCGWNSGYYISAGSRLKGWSNNLSGPDGMDTTAAILWLYFGAKRPVDPVRLNAGGCYWFTAKKNYRLPKIFYPIATDRSKPFTHFGSFQQRVRYTIHQNNGYGLSSQCEFTKNPNDGIYKEARRVMLKWVSDKRTSAFIPLQENPQRPYNLKENKANQFGYGENPFCQVLQKDGTVIGISAVPAKYPFWKMYAPFAKDGAILKRIEKDSWVFCHTGPMLFAFRYLQPSYWGKPYADQNLDVMWSDERNNGWILETSPISSFRGGSVDDELQRFAQQVLRQCTVSDVDLKSDAPSFSYRSLANHHLQIQFRPHRVDYKDQHKVDGKTINYMGYPHFGNPWIHQDLGSDHLVLRYGKESLDYNFSTWTKREGRNP
jgi:hypothetical protein